MRVISVNNNLNQNKKRQNNQKLGFLALVRQNPGGFPVQLNWLLENSQSVVSELSEKYSVKLTYILKNSSKKTIPLTRRFSEGAEKGTNKKAIDHILQLELQSLENPQKPLKTAKNITKYLNVLSANAIFTPKRTLKKPSLDINLNTWLNQQEREFLKHK